jgi:hypothetical protein
MIIWLNDTIGFSNVLLDGIELGENIHWNVFAPEDVLENVTGSFCSALIKETA